MTATAYAPVLSAWQTAGLVLLVVAVLLAALTPAAVAVWRAIGTIGPDNSLAIDPARTRPDTVSALVSHAGQLDTPADTEPDALDELIATAMPAELLAAAEEAISEALMILARAADLVAVTA